MDEGRVPAHAQASILAWYARHGRPLAFRSRSDPYAVLVSEVMAQQTQVSRVEGGWTAFLAAFPTFDALAAAPQADVLRAWRGLGYNRRALNLWRAARIVVDEHGGDLPRDLGVLERLPGVGPYTARAVAAIAFGMPVGAVDTNVRRVVARIVAGSRAAFPGHALQPIADASVPPDRPGDWTHASMDVGATICRPQAPACDHCPARRSCRYAATGGALEVARTSAPRGAPFPATSRWLRGRILDALRDGAGWVVVEVPIGQHDLPAIETALAALAADGLVERATGDGLRARLPIANAVGSG
jgi:A/G-specific adenine glycosylase